MNSTHNGMAEQMQQLWHECPTYQQFLNQSLIGFVLNSNNLFKAFNDFGNDVTVCSNRFRIQDLIGISFLCIVWTFARMWTTDAIFTPIAKHYGLSSSDRIKVPESAWKLCFYSLTTVLIARHSMATLLDPISVWNYYSLDNEIEFEIYLIYLLEISFYCHSVYATLRIDEWRRDSIPLLIHHILCICLLIISLTAKCHKSGLLALFLHDSCDVLLESTKLTRYFTCQNGRACASLQLATNVGFAAFAITWFVNRLYWFPLKHIYVTSVYVTANHIPVPFLYLLTVMLWLLLLMNLYWFSFIVRLLYKVMSGQLEQLEDNREYKASIGEELNEQQLQNDCKQNDIKTRYFLRKRKIDYNALVSGSGRSK